MTERELLVLEPIADVPEVGRWPRSPASRWVVHHLLQHESEHRSEIGWLRRRIR